MAETYLVTGGAGFIGSHIARRLVENGHRVIVVDNILTGNKDNIPSGCKFIYIDLANANHYYKLNGIKPTAVLHIAGQSSGEISFESPINDLEINTKATILLAKWAHSVGCERFLYASSVSVYGDGANNMPMAECGEVLPLSFYGCSKLASENYLTVFSKSFNMKTTCFRLFNVYGPGQNMDNMKQGMVSIYLSYILNMDKLEVKGSMERFRDFIYISDVVDMWVNSINNPQTYNKIFNLGTGYKTTVKYLIDCLLELTGKPDFEVVEITGTPGDSSGSLANMTYLENELGWKPQVSLKNGLKKMIDFYVHSDEWLKDTNNHFVKEIGH